MTTILSIIGTLLGLINLAWRIMDEFGSFLRIGLKVDAPKDNWATFLTTVENKGNRRKKIEYAIILVGPESERPVETGIALRAAIGHKVEVRFTNDFQKFDVQAPVIYGERAIIPLPFYYSENVDIADEALAYRFPLNISSFVPGTPYAVRFFVFAEKKLHRSTQDLFIVPPKSNPS